MPLAVVMQMVCRKIAFEALGAHLKWQWQQAFSVCLSVLSARPPAETSHCVCAVRNACHICPRSGQAGRNLLSCKLPINNTFVNEEGSQWEKPLRITPQKELWLLTLLHIQGCLDVAEPKDQPGLKPRRADFGLLGLRTSGSCLHL